MEKILCALYSIIPCSALAKSGSVNYSWGADALATMYDYTITVMFYIQAFCCAIAGVRVIVSGFQIYVKMNTDEDDITKPVVALVGTCPLLTGAFLIFLASFGYRIQKRGARIRYRHDDLKEL